MEAFIQHKKQLDNLYKQFNQTAFIENDPISIPHLFTKKQDIEIAGFFAAIFAWGQRKTIISKCTDLLQRMDNSPHEFITQYQEADLQKLVDFKHRTFNDTDLLYFVYFLHQWYTKNESLEQAFSKHLKPSDKNIENALIGFRHLFESNDVVPRRTLKHISSPSQNSACKKLCMYLRWMVRNDSSKVDFGIWKQIKTSQLICPLDLHVQQSAVKLGLLTREQSDWKAAVELTENLKRLDKNDPVKYDFALFGSSIMPFGL
jgi:uncharacterized protein (TIGR02757 family)